jgi:hypothetical protein
MMVAEGDLVGLYTVMSGTFAATNREVEFPHIDFFRIQDGKIAEVWVEWDNLSLMMQMGVLPPPEPVEAPISSIEDLVGVWNIQIEDTPFLMEYLPDGTGTIFNLNGAGGWLRDPDCPACEERFTFAVEDGELHFLTSELYPQFGEQRYEAFVTIQDGEPISLRFESVGFDPMFERRIAIDGQTLFPVEP